MTFVALTPEQRGPILPLAAQFNKWLLSLVDTIADKTTVVEDVKVLAALKSAFAAVTALKPTVPLEHYAYQVSDCLDVIASDPERFVTELAPEIAYVQKLGLTKDKWAALDNETRTKICQHLNVLGDMSNELLAYIDETRGVSAGGSLDGAGGAGGIPPEVLQQIMAMLPPALVAQVSQMPGGIEQLVASVISQNPALAALAGGGGASSSASAAASPLAGVGDLIGTLRSQLGDLPDDATPEQKNDFYIGIAKWLGDQVNVPGSIVSNMFSKFEEAFPSGLSRAQIDEWIERGRALLKVMGVQKGDAAWVLVRRVTGFIDKMQQETNGSTLCRATLAAKVTSLVRNASDCEGGLEGLFETAMESTVLKELASKFTGMPLAEVAKDPFAAATRAVGRPTSGSSFDFMSLLGGLGGGGSSKSNDDWSD